MISLRARRRRAFRPTMDGRPPIEQLEVRAVPATVGLAPCAHAVVVNLQATDSTVNVDVETVGRNVVVTVGANSYTFSANKVSQIVVDGSHGPVGAGVNLVNATALATVVVAGRDGNLNIDIEGNGCLAVDARLAAVSNVYVAGSGDTLFVGGHSAGQRANIDLEGSGASLIYSSTATNLTFGHDRAESVVVCQSHTTTNLDVAGNRSAVVAFVFDDATLNAVLEGRRDELLVFNFGGSVVVDTSDASRPDVHVAQFCDVVYDVSAFC